MKRKRHICAVLLCALVLAGLFTACGSSSNTAAADSAGSGNSSSVPYDDALADEMGWAADTENSVTDSTSETAPSGSEILSQEKIIRTASMEMETQAFDDAVAALDQLVEELDCDASAVQCWDALENYYGCAACLAMSMMGEAGKPSACESDVMGALTMLAMDRAAGSAPAYMDWNNNIREERDKCLSQHCSNFPRSFFGAPVEIENLDVLSTTLGAENCFGCCKGQVAAGPMTFAKLSTDDFTGRICAYVGEGEFLDEPMPTKGGLACCRIENLQGLMKYICSNGFEHHVAFVRGHVADVLCEAFGKYLGYSVYRHV